MRATIMYIAGDVRIENVPDATIELTGDSWYGLMFPNRSGDSYWVPG
jgi:hypothetical protein